MQAPNATLTLYALDGTVMMQHHISPAASSLSFNVSGWTSGIYVIDITDKAHIKSMKPVVGE